MIFDVTLNTFILAMPFIVISLVYGIIYSIKSLRRIGIISAIVYFALVIVYSPIISYKSHRDIIGTINEIEFSNEIEHIDLKQLPIIDTELAGKLADKKLREISSLRSQVTIGKLCLQSIKGELYYVAPLEHSSIIKWFTNSKGTTGYIKVSATNQNDVQLVTELNGTELNIKYLESAYLFSDLDRAAYLRDMSAGHTEYLHKVIN